MIRSFFLSVTLAMGLTASAEIVVSSAVVPMYMQAVTDQVEQQLPFYFWAELSGLRPDVTYRYTSLIGFPQELKTDDVLLKHELKADASGNYQGWFQVEKQTLEAGEFAIAQLNLNDGNGEATVTHRIQLINHPIQAISYGNVSGDELQGSLVYDYAPSTLTSTSYIMLYDNMEGFGRPMAIGNTETENKNYWRVIFPNSNTLGIRRIDYCDALSGGKLFTQTDADGWWCSGVSTVAMSQGVEGVFLHSNFELTIQVSIPDTVYVGQSNSFLARSNASSIYYDWNFGDKTSAINPNAIHSYSVAGTYLVKLKANNGACEQVVTKIIVVLKSSGNNAAQPGFYFTVAPNPSAGQVQLNTRTSNSKTITVMNLLGETIMAQQMTGNIISLDLSSYQQGIYLVQVLDSATGKTGIRKIVLEY